ncbi:MAG: VOC family protein [Anaerolineaceae bacterium]|jgi:predicted enzyme related to lactoylglutathione lyase
MTVEKKHQVETRFETRGVSLYSRNVSSLASYYSRLFNCPIEEYPEFTEIQIPGFVITVSPMTTLEHYIPECGKEGMTGCASIEIEVEDIDRFAYEIKRQNYDVIKPLSSWVFGKRTMIIRDPEGNLITVYSNFPKLDPETLTRAYIDRVFNDRDQVALDELLAREYINFDNPTMPVDGEAARKILADFYKTVTSVKADIEEVIGFGHLTASNIIITVTTVEGEVKQRRGLLLMEFNNFGRLSRKRMIFSSF